MSSRVRLEWCVAAKRATWATIKKRPRQKPSRKYRPLRSWVTLDSNQFSFLSWQFQLFQIKYVLCSIPKTQLTIYCNAENIWTRAPAHRPRTGITWRKLQDNFLALLPFINVYLQQVTSSTATLSLSETEASTEKPVKINRPQIFFPQPVLVPFQQQHQQQQPTLSQQFHQQPAFQQQPNMLHIRPISPPVIEAGFQPIIRGQGASNQPSPVRPGQVFGLRPAPPQQGPTGPIQSIKPIPQKNQQQNTTVSCMIVPSNAVLD